MGIPIEMKMEPVDDRTAKFVLSRSVGDFIGAKYTSQAETSDSPVAAALLEVPGIEQVEIFGNEVTALKGDDSPDWTTIEPGVYISKDHPKLPKGHTPFGVRIEDLILITKKDYVSLTSNKRINLDFF